MNFSTTGLKLAADSAVDLHLHTTYSDGRWTLEQLFDYLRQEKFALAAIADHDRPDTGAAMPIVDALPGEVDQSFVSQPI